jgi:archaeosine synthase beta-subunit
MHETLVFPESASERDEWIVSRRPQRAGLNAHEPYAFFVEEECGADGDAECVATIFLTNRECPFRCTMCDLWRNTLTEQVPMGAIVEQVEFALSRLQSARSVKLYNSGSFFDPRAIPPNDRQAIATHLSDFERVIVECHPAFVSESCVQFRDLLRGRLEIAMGLETVHPDVLAKLNKRMTLNQFSAAARFLRKHEIDLRVFILLQPPFMKADESLHWAQRSLDFAFDCDATAVTLIPTRGGNGAMETLAQAGMFVAPKLKLLEDAAAYGLGLRRGRVFMDLWDVKQDRECKRCFDRRVQRLRKMNLQQIVTPAVDCDACGVVQPERE